MTRLTGSQRRPRGFAPRSNTGLLLHVCLAQLVLLTFAVLVDFGPRQERLVAPYPGLPSCSAEGDRIVGVGQDNGDDR